MAHPSPGVVDSVEHDANAVDNLDLMDLILGQRLRPRLTKAVCMAASGWYCIADYHENPDVALIEARNRVFASGDYGDHFLSDLRYNFWGMPIWIQLLCGFGAAMRIADTSIRWVARGGKGPQSIDEVVLLAGESGTHSILDIHMCGQSPDCGVAYPLSFARRSRLFGTDKPTLDDWERVGWLAPVQLVQRWNAVYFSIYENDRPVHTGFVGCTGD